MKDSREPAGRGVRSGQDGASVLHPRDEIRADYGVSSAPQLADVASDERRASEANPSEPSWRLVRRRAGPRGKQAVSRIASKAHCFAQFALIPADATRTRDGNRFSIPSFSDVLSLRCSVVIRDSSYSLLRLLSLCSM